MKRRTSTKPRIDWLLKISIYGRLNFQSTGIILLDLPYVEFRFAKFYSIAWIFFLSFLAFEVLSDLALKSTSIISYNY